MMQIISGCQNGITMYETENNIVRTRCSYQTAGSYLEQESKQLNCFASDLEGLISPGHSKHLRHAYGDNACLKVSAAFCLQKD